MSIYFRLATFCAGIYITSGCIQTSPKQTISGKNLEVRSEYRKPASLIDEVRQLDRNKQTVCTLTLNSEEERELFRRHLGEKDFNFIELTNREGDQDDWFMNACRSGVSCDILIISGHFGGKFFGQSGLSLHLEELEKSACQSQCDGVLKHPKEVFLFGCNTLAGKKKDHRTQQDYVARLVEDDFSRADAERVAAFRYSPIGDTNEARMRRAFKGAKKLYGFDSVAPSGKNISGSLNNYFKSVGNYKNHLKSLNPATKNNALAKSLKWAPFVEARGWGDVSASATCYLEDPNIDNIKKLNWIQETFKDVNAGLQNSIFIHQYLSENEQREQKWNTEELALFESIRTQTKMRTSFESVIKTQAPGMTAIQSSVAGVLRLVGWWSAEEYRVWSEKKIGALFQNRVTREQVDDICSSGLRLDFVPSALQGNSMNWSGEVLEVIQCLQPSHPVLADSLLQVAVQHPDVEHRVLAIRSLRSLGAFNSRVQERMIQILEKESDPRILQQVTAMLRNAYSLDEEKQIRLANILSTPQFFLRGAGAAEILGALKVKSLRVQQIMINALGSEGEAIHEVTKSRIAEAFQSIKPTDPEIIRGLIEMIGKNTNYNTKYGAAGVLLHMSQLSLDNQLRLAEFVYSHSDLDSRVASLTSLNGSRPYNKDVRAILEKALEKESVPYMKTKINDALNSSPH